MYFTLSNEILFQLCQKQRKQSHCFEANGSNLALKFVLSQYGDDGKLHDSIAFRS